MGTQAGLEGHEYPSVRLPSAQRQFRVGVNRGSNSQHGSANTRRVSAPGLHVLQEIAVVGWVPSPGVPIQPLMRIAAAILPLHYKSFYENYPVLKSEAEQYASRLVLCDLTRPSLLEGVWLRKSLKIRLGPAKVCSHFPALLSP